LLLQLVPRGFNWRFTRGKAGLVGANLDKAMFGKLTGNPRGVS
jgi:hypothetical protein